jgi:L,D-transpeptidase catalytic domain
MRYLKQQLFVVAVAMVLCSVMESSAQTVKNRQPALTELEKNDPQGVQLRHTVIAFQKVEGRPRTGLLTDLELEAIRQATRPLPREAGEPHLEIDLHRQVLFVVEASGMVSRILPVSSGSGECFTEGGRTRRAITPVGRFKVERRVEGWRKSPLGRLYYPLYFHYGIAIHGNPAVPTKPASHGCIRIPTYAAIELSGMAPEGTPVIIYDSNPQPPIPPGPCPTPTAQ